MKGVLPFQRMAMASVMLLSLSAAQAAAGIQTAKQIAIPGTASLSFSADLMGALDTAKVTVAAYGAATQIFTKDIDGFYTDISVSAPLTTITYNPDNFEIFGMASTGGLTLTAPALKSVSSGGSLTVTDLRADFGAQTIYATVIGGNGFGTATDMALWHFDGLSGQQYQTGSDSVFSASMTGLSITTQGFSAFSQALGLQTFGKSALMAVTDFGTITTTLVQMDAPSSPWFVTSIPEPSSYALMGLGLAGVLVARRRQAAR